MIYQITVVLEITFQRFLKSSLIEAYGTLEGRVNLNNRA